jgi:excinuclease ABC subunit A
VVFKGTPEELLRAENSLTGKYLSGRLKIPLPAERRKARGKYLTLVGASANNLKDITVRIPLGLFTCVTGVSGSGKSSLVLDTLFRALAQKIYHSKEKPGKIQEIQGISEIDKVIEIDQSPIGRTPRSNPATYTGTSLPRSPNRGPADIVPGGIASTSRGDGAKPAGAMESLKSKCTFCPTST